MNQQRDSITTMLLILAILNGCTQAVDDADATPFTTGEVGQAPNPIASEEATTFFAPNIQTRVFQCATTTPQSHNTLSCGVPADWVLIGGGATISGDDGHGAMLTASSPVRTPFGDFW